MIKNRVITECFRVIDSEFWEFYFGISIFPKKIILDGLGSGNFAPVHREQG